MTLLSPQVKQKSIYIRDTTLVPGFPLLLFGGDISVQHREKVITVDDWIQLKVRTSRSGLTCARKGANGRFVVTCNAAPVHVHSRHLHRETRPRFAELLDTL